LPPPEQLGPCGPSGRRALPGVRGRAFRYDKAVPNSVSVAQGEIFEITEVDGMLTCTVVNRPEVTPEQGARCAVDMHDAIDRELLRSPSKAQSLVFDVRRGPPAFGPKTRASLEKMFIKAEAQNRRLAILVGSSPTQMLQFGSLHRECAPTWSRVFSEAEAATQWAKLGY